MEGTTPTKGGCVCRAGRRRQQHIRLPFVTGVSREGRIQIRLNLFVQRDSARRATSGFISNSPPLHIHVSICGKKDCVWG
jgi:hypothetical protein